MPYTPDATDVAAPDGATVKASTAAAEFRTIKTYLRDVLLVGLNAKAPLLNPAFLGTATFANATFANGPQMPTAPTGTADGTGATTQFVANASISAVVPGAASGYGLSLTSDGTDATFSVSAADALAILNYLGM